MTHRTGLRDIAALDALARLEAAQIELAAAWAEIAALRAALAATEAARWNAAELLLSRRL
jgi:hypothetical protein